MARPSTRCNDDAGRGVARGAVAGGNSQPQRCLTCGRVRAARAGRGDACGRQSKTSNDAPSQRPAR
eukprot:scaffold1563_cov307-Prasinococcus_capsulatus_cf.AAC.5